MYNLDFVINANGHYFTIDTFAYDLDKDTLTANGCHVYGSPADFVADVCHLTGLHQDEVEGTEMYITRRDGRWVCIEMRGCIAPIEEDTIEQFISEFVL